MHYVILHYYYINYILNKKNQHFTAVTKFYVGNKQLSVRLVFGWVTATYLGNFVDYLGNCLLSTTYGSWIESVFHRSLTGLKTGCRWKNNRN